MGEGAFAMSVYAQPYIQVKRDQRGDLIALRQLHRCLQAHHIAGRRAAPDKSANAEWTVVYILGLAQSLRSSACCTKTLFAALI